MSRPVIDHRGPEFSAMATSILARLKPVFKTTGPVLLYPSSGTGGWEAALVNTLSPGDKVLMFETGQFAVLWRDVAQRLGIEVVWVHGDWRHGAPPEVAAKMLAADKAHRIKAVCVVHNETSTGVASRIPEIRAAIDSVNHPALLLVDTVSSLGSIDFRHDEWGVDVTIACSQKGLMLPPGLGLNALSAKAMVASKTAKCPRSYWDWAAMLKFNSDGFFPYTPVTSLLYALDEALTMLDEEGLENVFARHDKLAAATRQAVSAWGLENLCQDEREYSSVLTAVMMPDGCNADDLRKLILERFNMSLGAGLGKVQGKVFRIGHLGELSELSLLGALGGVEMGLSLAGVPFRKGGVDAAMAYLAGNG